MKSRGGEGAGPGGRPGPGSPEFMKKFDKNGDGKLDDSEKEAAKAARGGEGGPKPNGDKPRRKPEDK
jgi:hypothetical protein